MDLIPTLAREVYEAVTEKSSWHDLGKYEQQKWWGAAQRLLHGLAQLAPGGHADPENTDYSAKRELKECAQRLIDREDGVRPEDEVT